MILMEYLNVRSYMTLYDSVTRSMMFERKGYTDENLIRFGQRSDLPIIGLIKEK